MPETLGFSPEQEQGDEKIEFESQTDAALVELENLRKEVETGKIKIPEPNSPEWQEIRELDQKWAEKLEPILEGVEVTELIEPTGKDGRSLEEERVLFFESLDDENSDHNPEFTYPNLAKIDLEGKEAELSQLRGEIKVGRLEKPDSVPAIVTRLYHYKVNEELAKVRWLQAIRDGDDRKAFHYANFIWGRLTGDHIRLAHERQQELIDSLDKPKDKSWQEGYRNLTKGLYGPEEIKEFFEKILTEYGIEDEWDVAITDEVSVITEQYRHPDGPRMAIPVNRDEVSAVKLLELASHEMEGHALNHVNGRLSELLILSGVIQADRAEDIKEGNAVLRQTHALKEIFGSNYPESGGQPWAILAMEQIQQGKNFRDTFRAVEEARYQYELKRAKGDEEKAKRRAREGAWETCRRTFRGVNRLSEGGRFFPKDKAYLVGTFEALQAAKAAHLSWLDVGLTNTRVLPDLYQLGVNPENIRYPYKNATKIVWERDYAPRHRRSAEPKSAETE